MSAEIVYGWLGVFRDERGMVLLRVWPLRLCYPWLLDVWDFFFLSLTGLLLFLSTTAWRAIGHAFHLWRLERSTNLLLLLPLVPLLVKKKGYYLYSCFLSGIWRFMNYRRWWQSTWLRASLNKDLTTIKVDKSWIMAAVANRMLSQIKLSWFYLHIYLFQNCFAIAMATDFNNLIQIKTCFDFSWWNWPIMQLFLHFMLLEVICHLTHFRINFL